MEWIERQLETERLWSIQFPHVLSAIAEAGIRFLMTECPFSEDWDKMKTLIVVNKFLNGLVAGQMIRRDQQWLVCNPLPIPFNMPNLDYGDVPEGTKPKRPSAILDPKENLREIFREFYNHVFRMRLADKVAEGNNSWAENLSVSHEWVATWNPGGRKMRTPLGCYIHRPDQRLFSYIIGAEIQEFCTLNVHIRSRKNPNVVVLLARLTNAQMGQNPGTSFNPCGPPPYHPFWSQKNEYGTYRRSPGRPSGRHEATMATAPQSMKKLRRGTRLHSPQPPGDQIAMLHHMDWQAKGALTSYDDGRYTFFPQPKHQLQTFKHYAQLLLHVYGLDKVPKMDLFDGVTYLMPQQLSFAPNFGFSLQVAQEQFKVQGHILELDERIYRQRKLNHHLNMRNTPNLRQGQPQEEQHPFMQPQNPNHPMNQQFSFNGTPSVSQASVPQPFNMLHRGGQVVNASSQVINQQQSTNVLPNGFVVPAHQQPADQPLISGGPGGIRVPINQQPARQPLNMTQIGGQDINASSQVINQHQSTNLTPKTARAPAQGQNSGQHSNMMQGVQAGNAFVQGLSLNQTANQQPPADVFSGGSQASSYVQNNGKRLKLAQEGQPGNEPIQGSNFNHQTSANGFHGSHQALARGPSGGQFQNMTEGPPQESTASFVPTRGADEQFLPQNHGRLSVPGQQIPTQANLTIRGNTQVKQENLENTQIKQEIRGNIKTEQEE